MKEDISFYYTQEPDGSSNKVYFCIQCKAEKTLERRVDGNGDAPYLRIRFEIFKRDNFTCQYCGRSPLRHGSVLHIDHVTPRIKGGLDSPENLITSCSDCNYGKQDILIQDHLFKKNK